MIAGRKELFRLYLINILEREDEYNSVESD